MAFEPAPELISVLSTPRANFLPNSYLLTYLHLAQFTLLVLDSPNALVLLSTVSDGPSLAVAMDNDGAKTPHEAETIAFQNMEP